MAANDKIIPTALLIANNLKGTKYSTKSTYKLTNKTSSKYKNVYTDAVEFLASVYAKELKVADFNDLWNYRNADDSPNKAPYTPNKNANYDILGQIVAFSEFEWNELQIAISKAFNVIYPFDIAALVGVYTPTEAAYYLKQMGAFGYGATATATLFDANGNPLGTFNQGVDFANAWNTLKVPADAALGTDTFFVAPIYKPASGTNYYYRYTGKRRWEYPFVGYETWAVLTPPTPPVDPDAAAFIATTGITGVSATALNQLVLDLKGFSLWGSHIAIYPTVGGTDLQHLVNLINVGTYPISYNGNWTHSATGALPDGATAFADTGIIPAVDLAGFKGSFSFYSRTNVDGFLIDTGSLDSVANSRIELLTKTGGSPDYALDSVNPVPGGATPTSLGFYTVTRTATNLMTLYKNGVQIGTSSDPFTVTESNFSIYIGARNLNGSPNAFSSREYAFAAYGTAVLTATDVANLYTAVQTFQTTLGRQV